MLSDAQSCERQGHAMWNYLPDASCECFPGVAVKNRSIASISSAVLSGLRVAELQADCCCASPSFRYSVASLIRSSLAACSRLPPTCPSAV